MLKNSTNSAYVWGINYTSNFVLDTSLWINSNNIEIQCGYRNETGESKWVVLGDLNTFTDQWHFFYCQKNATDTCAYFDEQVNCTTDIGPGFTFDSVNKIWYIGGDEPQANLINFTVDEFQFRKIALTDTQLKQLYYDGNHRLNPNLYYSNNSICRFWITNTSGTFQVKNQTLGYNVTTCTLSSNDTALFVLGNNITAEFISINDGEQGVSKNATVVQIIQGQEEPIGRGKPENITGNWTFKGNINISNADARFGLLFVKDLVSKEANEIINGNWSFLGFIGFGTKTPARQVHINDTLRIEPRSTAPTNPAFGDLYIDADTHVLCLYNSTNFVAIGGSGSCV